MRKFYMVIMLVVPIALMAQKGNYTLEGKIGNLNAPAKIYLSYNAINGAIVDSLTLQNGQFEFKGSVNDPIEANLVINRNGSGIQSLTNESLIVYLETGTIKVSSPDSLSNAKINGSKINAANEKLMLALKPSWQKITAFKAENSAMSKEMKNDKATSTEIQRKWELIVKDMEQVIRDFIKSNTNNYLSLDILKSYGSNYPENTRYTIVAPLFDALSAGVRHTESGIAYAAYLEKLKIKENAEQLATLKSQIIGTMAPNFTQNDPDGKPIKLSDFKGKYLLVDFWASWCGPCRRENPNVVKAYATYHDKGFEILGVSLDNTKEAWIKAINDDKLIWKHVSDLKGWNNQVGVLYGVHSVPQNLLIDPTGKVIARDLRGSALEQKLSEILK